MLVGFTLVLLGFFLIMLDVLMSPHEVMLFTIFPVIVGKGSLLSLVGITLIFVGMLVMFIEPFIKLKQTKEPLEKVEKGYYSLPSDYSQKSYDYKITDKEDQESSWGGVIFIGPIPIAFGFLKEGKYKGFLRIIGLLLGIVFILLFVMWVLRHYS
ncbi:MAG: hypothetical protein DRN30_04260 [Thermoplasmata archaeon]|nr:MAG: hypothetical protein DRN30_04260 [Thermoplasmata archaeon]